MVKRYGHWTVERGMLATVEFGEIADGQFVRFDDYAALEAERDKWRERALQFYRPSEVLIIPKDGQP